MIGLGGTLKTKSIIAIAALSSKAKQSCQRRFTNNVSLH
jgi:hypothetical protein